MARLTLVPLLPLSALAAADEWVEVIDPDRNVRYFVHAATLAAAWAPPPGAQLTTQRVGVALAAPGGGEVRINLPSTPDVDGWVALADSAGRAYWHHAGSQSTLWELPLTALQVLAALARVDLQAGQHAELRLWEQHEHEGAAYWYCAGTGVRRWGPPAGAAVVSGLVVQVVVPGVVCDA